MRWPWDEPEEAKREPDSTMTPLRHQVFKLTLWCGCEEIIDGSWSEQTAARRHATQMVKEDGQFIVRRLCHVQGKVTERLYTRVDVPQPEPPAVIEQVS